jgi:hypothetical protein
MKGRELLKNTAVGERGVHVRGNAGGSTITSDGNHVICDRDVKKRVKSCS